MSGEIDRDFRDTNNSDVLTATTGVAISSEKTRPRLARWARGSLTIRR
jgi:hypothetical protein